MTDALRFGFVALLLAASSAAPAATATLGVLTWADDPRQSPQRTALAYPGQPAGPALQGLEVALKESRFSLDAAGWTVRLDARAVAQADAARAAARALEQGGAQALVADLPAPLLLAAASATRLPVYNVGDAADTLREAQCRANVLHVLPSERMRADALAQYLASRRWGRVLLLHGSGEADRPRLAAVQSALQRHGLKAVATRPFLLSADPRQRQFANPLLLTGGVEHDVVWVVDADGEFARGLPYRTALPRPVVGDGGLVALAWAPRFERYGAPQLARRFERHAGRAMGAHDWAAWMAGKAAVDALLAPRGAAAAGLDGFKGVPLSFRAWDRQLRQPLLLADGQGVVATAPLDGVLHPGNLLDTLGADAPEGLCRIPH